MLSLIAAELFSRFVIGYPEHMTNRKYVLCPGYPMFSTLTLHAPYYRFWNVEGGNNVYEKNNLGLPGSDVDTAGINSNIIILGDSYMEAEAVPRDSVSTSYFTAYLKSNSFKYNVINAGCATFDPYTLWFRLKLFERTYKPSFVILVLEAFYENNLAPYELPLSFLPDENFGKEIPASSLLRIADYARTNSSFLNLIFKYLAQNKDNKIKEESKNLMPDREAGIYKDGKKSELIPESLKQCLLKYRDDYGDKFIAIGICPDSKENSVLEEYCRTNGIKFEFSNDVLVPVNRFKGSGHLNNKGNKKLGELFIEVFKRHIRQ